MMELVSGKSVRRGAGIVLVGISFLLALYPLSQTNPFALFERYLSANQNIEQLSIRLAIGLSYYIVVLLIATWGMLWRSPRSQFVVAFERIFLFDPVCQSGSPFATLIMSSSLGLIFIGVYMVAFLFQPTRYLGLESLFREDNFFESFTAIAHFASSLMIAITIFRLRKELNRDFQIRVILGIYLSVALALALIALEEISWGQRIFGWEASGPFASNYQHETNLHNFFNPYMPFFFGGFTLALFVVTLVPGILVLVKKGTRWIWSVFPHPSLLGVTVLIVLTNAIFDSELAEDLFAVWMLFYSVRIVRHVPRYWAETQAPVRVLDENVFESHALSLGGVDEK
jgi:hypothetical protein